MSLGNSEAYDGDDSRTRIRRGAVRPRRREGAGRARLHLLLVEDAPAEADSSDDAAWERSGGPAGRPRRGDGRGEGDERGRFAGGGSRGPGLRARRARGEGGLPPLRRPDRALVPPRQEDGRGGCRGEARGLPPLARGSRRHHRRGHQAIDRRRRRVRPPPPRQGGPRGDRRGDRQAHHQEPRLGGEQEARRARRGAVPQDDGGCAQRQRQHLRRLGHAGLLGRQRGPGPRQVLHPRRLPQVLPKAPQPGCGD